MVHALLLASSGQGCLPWLGCCVSTNHCCGCQCTTMACRCCCPAVIVQHLQSCFSNSAIAAGAIAAGAIASAWCVTQLPGCAGMPTCRMVRLKDAQKNIMPSGTTLCHSSMAGSGRWSMFSDGTCRTQHGWKKTWTTSLGLRHAGCSCDGSVQTQLQALAQKGWFGAVTTTHLQPKSKRRCLCCAVHMEATRGSGAAEHRHAMKFAPTRHLTSASTVPYATATFGYPPILLHHLRRRLILIYCLLTCDKLDATSSGSARNGLSTGCAVLLLAPSAVLPFWLLLSAAWLLEARFASTASSKAGPSLLSSAGEPDRDAAARQLREGMTRLLLLLQLPPTVIVTVSA